MTSSRPTASESRSTPRPEPAAGQQGRTAYFVRSMDWRRPEALAPIAAKAPSEFARLEAIPLDDSEILGGPSGIRTQDRRIKSQWLKLQNSPKTASKARKMQGNSSKQQESGRFQATSQIQNMTDMTDMRGWKRRSQAKRAHMCECCRRLLVEARLGPVPGRTPGLMPPATPPPSSSASSSTP